MEHYQPPQTSRELEHKKAIAEIVAPLGKSKVALCRNPTEGRYLVARRNISRGEPVVVYWGRQLTSDESYESYRRSVAANSEDYIREARYYRSSERGDLVIDGSGFLDGHKNSEIMDLRLSGVFVNDAGMPTSLNPDDLRKYLASAHECNLSVGSVEGHDFPVYYANRKIRKGERLTVHYGLGYWLLQLGVPPDRISDLLRSI